MNKLNKSFPYIIILLMGILITLLFDNNQVNSYISLNGMDSKAISINNETENISADKLQQIFDLAIKDEVILEKTLYDQNRKVVINYLVTTDLSKIFYNDKLEIQNCVADGFISTYKTTDLNCIYYLPDFMNNNKYEFHSYKEMAQEGIYWYGTYMVYYHNLENFDKFVSDISEVLSLNKEELILENSGVIEKNTSWLYMGTIGLIIFFIVFFFLISIYNMYRNSKEIGCLVLLGLDDKSILKFVSNRELINFLIISTILTSIAFLLIPNSTINYFLALLMLVFSMSIISAIINVLSLKFINLKINISNLIKKESLIRNISNFCMVLKGLVICLAMLFLVYVLPQLSQYLNASRIAKNNEYLNQYAVFKTINEENAQSSNTDNQLLFFQKLSKSETEYLYVNFSDYQHPEDYDNPDQQEANGNYYRIASVDENYLEKYPVQIIEDNLNSKGEYYLIPFSKKN